MTPSRIEIVVDFADCDPARIVYYPRYYFSETEIAKSAPKTKKGRTRWSRSQDMCNARNSALA